MKKKLFAAISLGILSTFVSGALTASAAELIVNGGPNNMTAEQKAEWVGEIQGGYGIAHDISMNNNRLELNGGDYSKYQIKGGYAEHGDALNNSVALKDVTGKITSIYGSFVASSDYNGYANGNSVTIDGFSGGIDIVIGGAANQGASNNIVHINNVGNAAVEIPSLDITAFGSIMGGDGKDVVANNKVIIGGNNGFYTRDIYGGNAWGLVPDESIKRVVTGNVVSISGSGKIVSHNIYGGFIDNGNAENNRVNISGQVHLDGINVDNTNEPLFIYGGYSDKGNAKNNIVDISEDAVINSDAIYGGYSNNGNVENNTINISGNVSFAGVVIAGGYSENGDAKNNTVFISNSNLENVASIYGAEVTSGEGKIENNRVILHDSSYKGIIVGGYDSLSSNDTRYVGEILGNYVEIKNSYINGNIYSGRGFAAKNVSDNVVNIIGCSGEVSVYGGYGKEGGLVKDNSVLVSNSEFKGQLFGGYANKQAIGNSVVVSNSEFEGQLVGGYANKEAIGNTVVINNSTITGSGGKSPDIVGGLVNGVGKADNNYVAVVDSTVVGNIYGGLSMVIPDPDVDDEETVTATKGSANNNTIYIENSKIEGTIVAGAVVADNKVTSEANNNTIIISGEKTNIASAALVGAKKGTGNTLILDGWSGLATSVAGFDNYSFQNIKNIDNAVLTVNSASNIGTNTKFDVSFAGSVDLQEGQSVKLISVNDSIDVNNENINTSVGTSLDVVGSLVGVDKGVDFKVDKITLNRQTDIVGTANAAAASFVADGAQLAVDGMEQLNRDEYGFNTFASAYGSNGDYDNGVDMKGWNTMVGVGHNAETESGAFAWGVFYETGSGEMKAENSYRKAAFGVDGKAVYNGYGAAARLSKDNGVYYEAGLRAGKLKNNLNNALMNAALATEGYKTESDYLGYHVGVGKAVALDNGDQLDVYARYYHTQVDGDSFVASGGERYYLDKVYSDRIRVGGRYSDELNEAVKVYYGAAYEYEFSGEAEGSVKGYALNKSDLGGSSFVGELGLLMNNPGSAWTVDMSLQTYAGQYEGIGGKVQATYHF